MTLTMVKGRTKLEWVSIENIIPNPLNPRKDHAVKTDEMQDILLKRGWEEGITVYSQGQYYVILSGHRRWHAARKVGIKEVPVYVVPAPENDQETVERMASLQRGHVDWTKYEWAKFTYSAWVYWGKPHIQNNFDKIVGIHKDTVRMYIEIFEYYPQNEIEDNLEKGEFSIKGLYALCRWMKRAKKHHEELVGGMSEDLVRKVMLSKMLKRKLGNEGKIKSDEFVSLSSSEQMKQFLTTPNMSLQQAQAMVGAKISINQSAGRFQGAMQRISYLTRDIEDVMPQNEEQKKTYLEWLNTLERAVRKKKKELQMQ